MILIKSVRSDVRLH